MDPFEVILQRGDDGRINLDPSSLKGLLNDSTKPFSGTGEAYEIARQATPRPLTTKVSFSTCAGVPRAYNAA
jgi:hypothetical protein